MNIDYEYLKNLLDVFTESDKALLSIMEIVELGFEVESSPSILDERYLFHVQIMMDNQLISDADGKLEGLKSVGIMLNGNGTYRQNSNKMRLTQSGHDFSKALSNSKVLEKIKNEFKNAPFKAVFDGSQKLLGHFMKKKLNEIMDESNA